MLRRLFPSMLAALLLAGCAQPAPPSPSAARASAGAAADTDPVRPVMLAVPPAPAQPGPGDLLGMSAARVDALLGDPSLLRREPPAELRQYLSTGCVLHLFLYQDEATGAYKVAHLEARPRGSWETDAAQCLSGVLRASAAAVQ